jgi:ABC-type glutathione transport system ATPase component
MLRSERDGSNVMARIDLVNVSKTLKDRERAGSGSIITAAMRDVVSAPSGGGRGSVFSIQNLNLTIPDGETMVILGPSGCGKTTLLKIIAGLIPPDSGKDHADAPFAGGNILHIHIVVSPWLAVSPEIRRSSCWTSPSPVWIKR